MRDYDILCIGEVNVDLILSGIEALPEFGREVLARGVGMHLGGCTANVATFAAALGMRAALRARVGRDDFGDFLMAELEKAGVSTEFVIRDDTLSTGLTVSLSGARDRAFVTYLGTIDGLSGDDVQDALFRRARHVHIGSYFMQRRLQPSVAGILRRARQDGLTTSLDPGYDPYEEWDSGVLDALQGADVFMPNEVEAPAIAGVRDPWAAAARLAETGARVALKLGEDGAALVTACDEVRAPGFRVQVVDTTCCGDAFNAGLLCAMLDGKGADEMLRWGNAAGAIVAGGSGASTERLSRATVGQMVAG